MPAQDRPRYLTKSLFVRALGCPTKLAYVKKPEYPDNSVDDAFLEALAEGGIQVGELAKCYFPGGVMIDDLKHEAALAATARAMAADKAVVFEAAIRHGNLFVRADILVKDGNRLDLIEVKAKSCDADESFVGKRTGLPTSEWKPYLYDVAFQKHVLGLAFPDHEIRAFLMLADKSAKATVDGLNQMFVIEQDGGRASVRLAKEIKQEGLGERILVQVNVDDIADALIGSSGSDDTLGFPFAEFVDLLADSYAEDRMIDTPVGAKCKACEFTATAADVARGLRSGFRDCWGARYGLSDAELDAPSVFDIWNCRRNQALIEDRKFLLRDVEPEDIAAVKADGRPGLSSSERQALQLEKAKAGDSTPFIDAEGLAQEMSGWKYPLHFIDFETSAVALPFHAGMRPYEGVAFQFSHHVAEAGGVIRHAGEYINVDPGVFPSYEFVRALKQELGSDEGTIFRYAAHENTYLLMIRRQLLDEPDGKVPDRDELCRWIETVTESKTKGDAWKGDRSMVDMKEMVLRYHYDPATKGSNSLKAVLPASLNSSRSVREKYSQPVYGAGGGVPSLNYRDWQWVQEDGAGKVIDPYKLLPPIETGLTDAQLATLEESTPLADGAAAMTAYARLQFESVPDKDRQATREALLRYCELDTFAMVLLWECWKEHVGP